MKKLMKGVSLLALAAALSACGQQQAKEYIGNWQAKEYANRTVKIERNGDNFVIKTTAPTLYAAGQSNTTTLPAVYKDGMLEASNGLGTARISYVKESDTLLMPTMGGSMEYRRVK